MLAFAGTIMGLLIFFLAGAHDAHAQTLPPNAPDCTTPAQVQLISSHELYQDYDDKTDELTNVYVQFQITNTTAFTIESVKFGITDTTYITRASHEDEYVDIHLAPGESTFVYYYLKTFSVLGQNGSVENQPVWLSLQTSDNGAGTALCKATQLFTVHDVARNESNKIDSVRASDLGDGCVNMFVNGRTGNAAAPMFFAVTPAALDDWPANLLNLVSMTATVQTSPPMHFTNTLLLNGLPEPSGTGWPYTIAYKFCVADLNLHQPFPPLRVRPVSYIDTGADISQSPFDPASGSVSIPLPLGDKTDGGVTVTAGGMVVYDVTVTNIGTVPSPNVVITDTVPENTVFASAGSSAWQGCVNGSPAGTVCHIDVGTVYPTSTITYTFAVVVDQALPASIDVVTNTIVGNPSSILDDDFTPVIRESRIGITKSDGLSTVLPGEMVTYTIVVSNAGPSALMDAIVSDVPPATFLYSEWQSTASNANSMPSSGIGDINATVTISSGGFITYTLSGKVAPGATGMLANTSVVIAPANITLSNSITEATDVDAVVLAADLSIIKTADPSPAVVAGTQLTYTLVVANAGPSDIDGAILNDALPVALTNAQRICAAGAGSDCGDAAGLGSLSNVSVSLNAGSMLTITLTGIVDPAATGSMTNTATITVPAGAVDTDASNNSSTVSTQMAQMTDLSIDKQGPATAVPGLQITYTIIVTNNGPSVATNVSVSDTVPAALLFERGDGCDVTNGVLRCDAGTLVVNASQIFTATFNISASATDNVTNTAGVTSTQNTTSENDTAVTVLMPVTNLSIVKRAPATAIAGEQLAYTLAVTNNGPSQATGVTVSDTVPADLTFISASPECGVAGGVLTCDAGTLPVNAGMTFTATFQIGAAARGVVGNTAAVTSTEMPTETTTTVTTTITADVALQISKAGPATAVPGTQLTYAVVVTNNGPSDATNVTINDPDAANLSAVNSPCVAGVCAVGSLNVGQSHTLTLVYNIDPFATGSVTNTASVTSAESTTPQWAQAVTQLTPKADLAIFKTDGQDTANYGTPLTYTIVVSNNGPSGVVGAMISDTMPVELTGWSWTCDAVSPNVCSPAAGSSAITPVLTLAPNSTVTITVAALLATTTQDNQDMELRNIVSVDVPQGVNDDTPGNNTAIDSTQLGYLVDVSVMKTVLPGVVIAPGQWFTYLISIGNAGPSYAQSVSVSDTLPAEMTLAGWTCQATSGAHCADASGSGAIQQWVALDVGEWVTFTIAGEMDHSASGEVTNTAIVNASDEIVQESDLSNNTDSVTVTVSPNAFVGIGKTDGQSIAIPGTTITYQITLKNDGPSDAHGGQLRDILPPELSNLQVSWQGSNGASVKGDPTELAVSSSIWVDLPEQSALTITVSGEVNLTATGWLTNVAEYVMEAGVVANNPITRAIDVDEIMPAVEVGKVFHDANGNGVLDAGEMPMPGIKVMLTCDGRTGVEMTTDADGAFSQIVPPGLCAMDVVVSSVPAGYRLTTNNDHQSNIALVGLNVMPAVGYQGFGSVTGVTFDDINANRVRDDGEPAIPNVVVTLSSSGIQPALMQAAITTTSDANGNYRFADVAEGSYTLNAQLPSGFVNTTPLPQNATVQVNANTMIDLGFQNPGVLVITKAAHTSGIINQLGPDRLITYTLMVTNTGGGILNNVLVTDTLQSYLLYVAGSATPAPVSTAPLVWQLGNMMPGANVKIQFVVSVVAGFTGTSSNVAIVDSDETPPVPSNEVVINPMPTAISIVRFTAQHDLGGVTVMWQTGFERYTAGFNLLRSTTGSRADAARVNPDMILAGEKGGLYSFVDNGADASVTYTYWLQEIEVDGTVNDYAETAVTQGTSGQHVNAHRVFVPMLMR